jgi:enamine deaminase RidA (YjgF/YER057c/UK114 family)
MSNNLFDTLPPRTMPNIVLQPSSWPQPKGYANGIKARGDLLFVGGMVGCDERGRFAADFVGQTRQLLANIMTVLAEGGASARHIVRMTWYVRDMDEYLKARPASAKSIGR